VRSQRAAQFNDAEIGGVVRFSALQRFDSRHQDGFGGGKIRFTDAQRDDVFHGGGDIEKLPDA